MIFPVKEAIRIAYDITRLSKAGANGGIKVHLYSFLHRLSILNKDQFHLIVLARPAIISELPLFAKRSNIEIYISEASADFDLRDLTPFPTTIHYLPTSPSSLLKELRIDLLYAGFGDSDFHDPEVPQIGLIVDCLHRDLPNHLPDEEVAYRNEWYVKAIRQSNLIQTNSDFCIHSLQKHYNCPNSQILRIYLPLHERFPEIKNIPLTQPGVKEPYFFYPANFWSHKNHEGLLVAYHQYLKSSSLDVPWHLILTGHLDENAASLQSLTCTLGIESHVHFLGHVNEEELKAIWEHASSLVFPSLYEGFGLPIVEAMHFQTPIACSQSASLPEIANGAALLFDPRKPESIASALLQLSEDPELREKLIEKGRKTLPSFQLDKEVEQLSNAIESLVAEQPN